MLTPTTHKLAIYIAFVLLSVCLLLMSLLVPQTINAYHGGYTTTDQESDKLLIDRRIASYTLGLAFFTAMLALSTIGLWFSADKLWKVTRDIADRQEENTRILQRAYITARRRGIDVTQDGNIIGQLAFVNVGRLPARKFCVAVKICWSDNQNLNEFEELPLEAEVILPAKTSFPSGTMGLPTTDVPHFHDKEGFIFVWGRVSYTDGFGHSRWLKFCHRYNCRSPRNDKGGIDRRYGRYHHHHNDDDGGT